MVHDFHKVVALAEKRLHLKRVGFGVLCPALQKQLGQIAAQACRKADQSFGVLLEQLVVDAGLVVKALGKPGADQLDEVAIAGLVFTQQNHMAVFARRAVLLKAVGTDIHLAADDGGDALLQAGVIEVDDPVHHAVIGHGGVREAKLLKTLDQGLDAVGPVQEAVFGMQMQMSKGHGRLLWAGGRYSVTSQLSGSLKVSSFSSAAMACWVSRSARPLTVLPSIPDWNSITALRVLPPNEPVRCFSSR